MYRPLLVYLCACAFLPRSAHALEISGGVSVGGILIGTEPRLTVSPQASMAWRFGSVALSAHDHLNLMPSINKIGVGVYNQTSIAGGYAWDAGNLSVGPTLSIYSMPACAAELCGRAVGMGAGGHAQVNVYFAGPLGVSVSANLDWLGGASLVLPGTVVAMVIAGPVLRWSPR